MEAEIHLKDYGDILLKRKWVIFASFIIIVFSVLLISLRMTPIYEASTRILIEKEKGRLLSFDEVYAIDTFQDDYYHTQYNILKSRTILERVFSLLNLGQKDEFRKYIDPIPHFLEKIQINPVRNSRLVDISARDIEPFTASRIANTLTDVYIKDAMERKLKASEYAVEWLTIRLKDQEKLMQKSEEDLLSFKKEKNIISLEQNKELITHKIMELNSLLAGAQNERLKKEAVYNQLEGLSFSDILTAPVSVSEETIHEQNTDSAGNTLVFSNPMIMKIRNDIMELKTIKSQHKTRYLPKHPEMVRLDSRMDVLEQSLKELLDRIIESARLDYDAALYRENMLKEEIVKEEHAAMDLDKIAIEYGILQNEVDSNSQIYETLLSRAKETTLTGGLEESNIMVIDQARVPDNPIIPNIKVNLLLAIIIGLLVGTTLAFFFEYLDNTVKSKEDIERYLQLPYLGAIPNLSSKETKSINLDTVAFEKPNSALAESYRFIRVGIRFFTVEKVVKSILVTSAFPGEGKTTESINLAITMAQAGEKVLLIDTDLRNPRIHKTFTSDERKGLSFYLADVFNSFPIVLTQIKNLSVMHCGIIPPNPTELLESNKMKQLLSSLKNDYDRIILDSPPILSVADPLILANVVDGIILVVQSAKYSRKIAQDVEQKILQTAAKPLGIILNRIVPRKNKQYYSYYYNYNYGYGKKNKTNGKKEELNLELTKKA
ncbi:GumC family protein [Chlamydiota bacterium]